MFPHLQEAWLLSRERELKEEVRQGRDKEIELAIQRLEEETSTAREECERAADNRWVCTPWLLCACDMHAHRLFVRGTLDRKGTKRLTKYCAVPAIICSCHMAETLLLIGLCIDSTTD